MRLGGVLEHRHAEIGQHGRPPVEVHRDHGARALGAPRPRPRLRRCVAVSGSTSTNTGTAPGRAHRRRGRHRGERGHDHLVAGTDARARPATSRSASVPDATPTAWRRPANAANSRFERVELGAEEVRARAHDARRPPRRARARAPPPGGRGRRRGCAATGCRRASQVPRPHARGRTRPCARCPSANEVRGSQPSMRFAFDESPK